MRKTLFLLPLMFLSSCWAPSYEYAVKELTPSEVVSDTASLEAGLILDKTIYRQGEPVYCYVYLKNTSDKYITVYTRLLSDDISCMGNSGIIFTLTPDVNRKTYKTINPAPPIEHPGNFNLLRPGERYYNSDSYDINDIFGSPLKPGSYKLKARYINYNLLYIDGKRYDAGDPTWLGEIDSKEAEFTVEP